MDRRAFLRHLGFGTVSAAAASLTWDVERLIWVPGVKTILLPAPHLSPEDVFCMTLGVPRAWIDRHPLIALMDLRTGTITSQPLRLFLAPGVP